MKKKKRIRIIILGVIILLLGASIWYVNDYYHADGVVGESLLSSDAVTVTKIKDGYFFDGKGTENAIIFYPGAKVEYTAYAPLMNKLAENGVDCFLLKMPCNLAFLGKNKANKIMGKYDYDNWYISGHSLGGAMAAAYAAKSDKLSGIILLAAYPTSKLPQTEFSLLSIYGSEDGVLNLDKVETGKKYWPDNSKGICIEGGNHAYYGNYGEQSGDGKADITREEQQKQTLDAILEWLNMK